MFKDARLFQIAFLGILLGAGILLRDFSVQPLQILLTFFAGLATQFFFIKKLKLSSVGYRSAWITCTSLSLLLRADNYWVHPLAATLAMSSKFLIRAQGKHIFNPGNFGVIIALALFPGCWVSSGQWGYDIAYAGWFLVLGGYVVFRAHRSDISWAFLAFFLGLIALRVAALGQSWNVWLHQFQNGALLLFAFFMISDPMTIPNHPVGRLIYAFAVALFAFVWQFKFFHYNGLLWSLFFLSPVVPWIDRRLHAEKFRWSTLAGAST